MPHQRTHSPSRQGKVLQAQDLIAVVQGLLAELYPQRAKFTEVTASSRLRQDLGIDSLGRMELILRIERAFNQRLPVKVMGEAETIRDILSTLERAQTAEVTQSPRTIEHVPLPAVAAATEARTLIEVLEWHVARHPDRRHLTLLQDDRVELAALTYCEIANAARLIAAGLIARDVSAGDRVAIMLPTSSDFFTAFFGILYSGAIPVPIYPPMQLSQIEEYVRRQAGILRNAAARVLITPQEGLRLGAVLRGQVPDIACVESAATLSINATARPIAAIGGASATALIQYTSGSTGDPKGVVLSHDNLLANIRAIGRAIEATSADVMVSWLPLYHDMGLIGAWLGSLYFGAPFYVMSPLSFLARPQSWLWAMHRFRATISAAPNFAFERCIDKIDDAELAGLDLSSLRFLANGAEPVSVRTLRRFCAKFARYGFHREAMAPVYGLAECAVSLTLPPPGRGPLIDRVNRHKLSRDGFAELARADDANAVDIVACGQPIPSHEVRIVDDLGRELGERREGSLEFRGPSTTSGYFRNDIKTKELFRNGWLDSGDRGYMAGGEIFITGRAKDMIIRAGQHIYPQEIEDAIGAIKGVTKGGVAVFGVEDRTFGTERVVLLVETEETETAIRNTLQEQAGQAAAAIIGAPMDEILLVPTGTVPKTSSGKIRRAAARALYLAGQLVAGHRPMRWQLARLWIASLAPRLLRSRRLLAELGFAFWWWTTLACGLVLGAAAVVLLPSLKWRWTAVRGMARAVFAATGTPVTVEGLDQIPRMRAMLMVNHASYADALALAALLPGEPVFIAKRELANEFLAGPLLRRLGALFVDRLDLASGQRDTDTITEVARQDRVLVSFPEGTFTRRPGLSEFYLGAFKVAAEAGIPIVPGALRGTRSLLRSDQWFPRRSTVRLTIASPIMPMGTELASVVRLRDTVRAAILLNCGEPDLAELVKPAAATARRP